jgi:hypothetical protein
MFEIGERVVCVDADWSLDDEMKSPCPLVVKKVYTVLAVLPAGTVIREDLTNRFTLDMNCISVGVECPGLNRIRELCGSVLTDDAWEVERFRKLQKLDIKQALAALIDLTNTKELETT